MFGCNSNCYLTASMDASFSLCSFTGSPTPRPDHSSHFDYYNDDSENDEDFDNSLERTIKTPGPSVTGGVYNPRPASQFYNEFSVWLYHGVTGTPQHPLSWTPARTPWQTPGKTPVSVYRPNTPQSMTPMTPVVLAAPREDEEMYGYEPLDDPENGRPKFANPWAREVAVLSWRTAMNMIASFLPWNQFSSLRYSYLLS